MMMGVSGFVVCEGMDHSALNSVVQNKSGVH